MLKDRYSSIMMNYKIAQDIAVQNKPKNTDKKLVDMLPFVQAKRIRAT